MRADPNAPQGAMIRVERYGPGMECWEGWTSDGKWYLRVQEELIPDLLEAGVIREQGIHDPDAYIAAAWHACGPEELPGVHVYSPGELALLESEQADGH